MNVEEELHQNEEKVSHPLSLKIRDVFDVIMQ